MLVTLEGLDGSGKTTVLEELKIQYPDACFTREPTRSWYGEAVRRSINDNTADPIAELFLYVADHADHLSSTIDPALRDDQLVLSDRYIDSRMAYQAATLPDTIAEPLSYIRSIHAPFTRWPDLTVYLDIDPETAVDRTDRANKFEQLSHLRSVQRNYEQLLEEDADRFVRIDATAPPDEVAAQVIETIESHQP